MDRLSPKPRGSGAGHPSHKSCPLSAPRHCPLETGSSGVVLGLPPAGAPCPQHTPLPHRCPQSPAHPRVYLPLHPKWLLLLTPRSYPRSPLPRPNPRPLSEVPPPPCTPTPSAVALQKTLGPLLHQGEACWQLYLWTPPSAHTPPCTPWHAPIGGAPASSELTHTRAAPFLVPGKGNAQKASPALWRQC